MKPASTTPTRPGQRELPEQKPDDQFLTDQKLAERARALYRRAAPAIDTSTAARLGAARRRALDVAGRSSHHLMRWMMPAGAFAVAALAVGLTWQPLRRAPAPTPTLHAISTGDDANADAFSELPPDADSADPALYQNLDFYAWLAQQPRVATTRNPKGN